MGGWHNKVALGGRGVWNVIVNRHLPAQHYVPANLTVAAATYLLGRAGGLNDTELGTGAGELSGGLRWGATAAGLVASGVVLASRQRATRGLFNDARAAAGATRYETLLRIPLGTVVLEEVAFRGVLPALFEGAGRRGASLRSGAAFGLWHILPTLKTLDINGVSDPESRLRAVAGGVAATAAAGLLLDRLRLRSRSLLAPMLTHWTANAVSYAIAARRPLPHPRTSKPALRSP